MNLNKKIIGIISFGGLERIFDLLFGLIASIITVRYLSRYDYGVISYVLGIIGLTSFLNFAPETYLYKVYIKLSKEKIKEYISTYILFTFLKAVLIIIVNVIVGIILLMKFNDEGYLIVIIGSSISLILSTINAIYIVILELDFKQKLITKVFLISKLIRTLIILYLIISPSLYVVVFADIVFSLIQIIIYTTLLTKKKLIIKIKSLKSAYFIIKDSLLSYSIWTHFIGVTTQIIYKIDPFILGFFTSMSVVGRYSIALNISNYFIIIFMVLQKAANVALGNMDNAQRSATIALKLSAISFIIAIIQLIAFFIFGKYFLLLYIDEPTELNKVYQYLLYIIIGLSIFNVTRPLVSFITIIGSPKEFFLKTILPTGFTAIVLYILAAHYYSAEGLAIANIIVYFIASVLVFKSFIKTKRLASGGKNDHNII